MNKSRSLLAFLFVAAVLALAAVAPFLTGSHAQSVAPGATTGPSRSSSDNSKIKYPESKKVEQIDDYFGHIGRRPFTKHFTEHREIARLDHAPDFRF